MLYCNEYVWPQGILVPQDMLLVMEEGKIAASGRYDDLKSSCAALKALRVWV